MNDRTGPSLPPGHPKSDLYRRGHTEAGKQAQKLGVTWTAQKVRGGN